MHPFTSSSHFFVSCPSRSRHLRCSFLHCHLSTLQRRSSSVRNGRKGTHYRCDALLVASSLLHTGFTSRKRSRYSWQIRSIFPRVSIFTRLWFHLVEFIEIFRSFGSISNRWFKNSQRGDFETISSQLIARESIFSWRNFSIRPILIIFLNTKWILLFVDDDRRDQRFTPLALPQKVTESVTF